MECLIEQEKGSRVSIQGGGRWGGGRGGTRAVTKEAHIGRRNHQVLKTDLKGMGTRSSAGNGRQKKLWRHEHGVRKQGLSVNEGGAKIQNPRAPFEYYRKQNRKRLNTRPHLSKPTTKTVRRRDPLSMGKGTHYAILGVHPEITSSDILREEKVGGQPYKGVSDSMQKKDKLPATTAIMKQKGGE